MVCDVVFCRHGYWADVLRRRRAHFALCLSTSRRRKHRGSRARGFEYHAIPLGHSRLGDLHCRWPVDRLFFLPSRITADHPFRALSGYWRTVQRSHWPRRRCPRGHRHHVRGCYLAGPWRGSGKCGSQLSIRCPLWSRRAALPDRCDHRSGNRFSRIRFRSGHSPLE